ncbi:MAG: ABC transporter ATP-binding protein [bacterium]
MESKNKNNYPKVYISDVINFFWKGIGKNKLSLFVSVTAIALGSSASIISPVYYKKFFDVLSQGGDKAVLYPQLFHFLFIILGINFVSWALWRIGSFAVVHFEAHGMADLRTQAYRSLIFHSYSFFANNFTGAIVQRVGRYARAFEKIIDRITWDIVPLVVRVTGILIVTYYIEPKLTLIIIFWTLIYMMVSQVYSMWRFKHNVVMAEADSRTTAVLADTITNQNNIELFSSHKAEIKNFDDVVENQRRITQFNWNMNIGFDGVQALFSFVVEFIVFYFAIHFWQGNIFTVGSFVLIQLYVIGLSGQLWGFARIIRDFYEGYADAKEMVEIMKLPYEIKDTPTSKSVSISFGEILFDNVNFSFNGTREVLSGINLCIKSGEKVALVGPSGAGKTTFVRLLLRFYELTGGNITIDKNEIKDITLESLRNNISLVPQDPLLFHRTIKENIRYGKPDATDEEIVEAARLAHCSEFIENLPKKYDTYVGERGIKLSGGERQRVAIARAILKNAPILILDEATSSLDSHSESLIQDALDTLMKGKTTIVIAHRLSTIKKMDRIIVLKGGKIVEDGSHSNLVKEVDGMYKKLWELQAGGFIQ